MQLSVLLANTSIVQHGATALTTAFDEAGDVSNRRRIIMPTDAVRNLSDWCWNIFDASCHAPKDAAGKLLRNLGGPQLKLRTCLPRTRSLPPLGITPVPTENNEELV